MKKWRNMERAMAPRRRGFCHGGIVRRLWFSLRLNRRERREEVEEGRGDERRGGEERRGDERRGEERGEERKGEEGRRRGGRMGGEGRRPCKEVKRCVWSAHNKMQMTQFLPSAASAV